MDRSELINFIADLAGPIDPSVFAGFGSKVQMRISSNSLAGEKIKTEWVSKADAVAALDVLFDIACNPPDETFENNFYGRFKENWEFEVADLIYRFGNTHLKELQEKMAVHEKNANVKSIIELIRVWLSESG
ncbi:MAG: hypothetical protein KDJ99_10125 [Candidatus Competibacteraceae bacterium]|nr:hypothetical protein [Candidatus Competibacteraceae bacterium]